MNEYAADRLNRARRALKTAQILQAEGDYDGSALRAYYAAFYAVSALFAVEGKRFKKHSAVESALHKDLIQTGRLPKTLGGDYAALRLFRNTGDYGDLEHVTAEQAAKAIEASRRILDDINLLLPS